MAAEPVLVTGMGLVTPFGIGVRRFWTGLTQGRTAFSPVTRFSTSGYQVRMAGEVPGTPGRPYPQARSEFLRAAVAEAVEQAQLRPGQGPVLTVMAVPGGPPGEDGADDGMPEVVEHLLRDDLDLVAREVGAPLVPVRINQACSTGTAGLALARTLLRAGRFDRALVVGAEALNAVDYSCMDAVRALTRTTPRPFDAERSGMLVGEGAGALVLERRSQAGRPDAAVELRGIGASLGARWHVSIEAEAAELCIRRALADAGVSGVDYVHAFGNGSPLGDEVELQVLGRCLGGEGAAVPVSSHKGAIGHLLRSSGFPAVAAAAMALREAVLPPTAGYRRSRGPTKVQVLSGHAVERRIDTALVDQFGFCGNNVALVLSRPTG